MLHVFVGNDVVAVRKEAHVFLQGHGEAVRITADTYERGMLIHSVQTHSLFDEVHGPVVLDFLSEDEVALEDVADMLREMQESERVFVFLDQKPKAALEKKLRAHATAYREHTEGVKKESFSTFTLADALARKDKKSLWVLLQRARMAGVSAEEIAGVLFWQLKTLMLAARTRSATEAGVSEYPYKKAKAALKDFSPREIERLSEALLTVYHRGHAESDMELGLERFVLTL